MITHSTLEGPVEKFLGILVGQAADGFNLMPIVYALLALAVYILLFIWYVRQMKKRNAEYAAQKAEEK